MSDPSGGYGLQPRRVNRAPRRKTVPTRQIVTDVSSTSGYNHPAPRPAPAPSWTRPIGQNTLQPPKPKPTAPSLAAGLHALGVPTIQQTQQHLAHQAKVARAQQVHAAARRDVLHILGAAPVRVADSNDWLHPKTLQIGSPHHLTMADHPPVFRGAPITEARVAGAMHAILQPGYSLAKMHDVALLHAAGIVNPYGTTTHPEHVAQQHQYRAALIHRLIGMQQQYQGTIGKGGLAADTIEITHKLRNLPTSELERLTHWKPSDDTLSRSQIQTAGFNLQGISQLAQAGGSLVSGAVRANIPGTAGKILGNVAGDLVEIPGEAIPSTYFALRPLGHGDVIGSGKLFAQPFIDLAKHPGQSFENHPLGSTLMALGVARGIGRGAGFIARHGTEGMREAGSLDRGRATLPDTNFTENRRYSPDLVVKQFQKRQDLRGFTKAKQHYAAADKAQREAVHAQQHGGDAAAKFRLAAHEREQAYRADPSIITDASKVGVFGKTVLQRSHDEFESLVEGLRRLDRGRVVNEATKALGKKPSNLTRPVVEGIVAAARDHVEAYLQQIKTEAKTLDPVVDRGKLLANEQLQGQIRKALEDPKTDMREVLDAAERYSKVVAPRQAELAARKLVDPEQADHAAMRSYSVRYMGAKLQPAHYVDKETGEPVGLSDARKLMHADPQGWRNKIVHISDRVVGPHGKSFTPEEIRAHMADARQAGEPFVSDPSFVSQQPNLRSSSAYFRRWNPRVGVQSGLRTGKAVTEGTIDAHPSTLVDQAAKTQSLLSADKAFQGHVDQYAYRAQNGEVFQAGTKGAANEMANELAAHGSPVKWRPVRLNPLGGNPDALAELLNSTVHDEHTATQGIHKILQDAYESADGQGPWGLIPDQVAARAADHQKLLGAQQGVKALQKITNVFRRVVLQRPSFLEGNAFEAMLRGALHGALPGMPDYFFGRALLDALPVADRDSVLEGVIGGGHMHMAARANIHRPVDQLGDGRLANTAKGVAHTRVAQVLTEAWDRWNHLYFEEINARIERQFRLAIFGKDARQMLLPGKLVAVSSKSVQEAAHGLTDTATQRLLGRMLDDAYGQYDKFTPEQKRWLMLYTPFGAWMLNSLRFALQTLPRDHPVVTSLLAAATQTSQDWRKAHGLSQLAGKNRVPGFLQGSIPGGDGSYLRTFTRYTPAGFWSDPLAALAGAVLPQLSGVESAFQGTDWKGTPLKDQSVFGKLAEAGKEFGAEVVPGLGQGQQIFTGKGTTGERVRKFFDPFMYTKSAAGGVSGSGDITTPRNAVERAQQRAQQHLASGGAHLSPAVVAAQKRAQALLAGKP